MGYHGDSIAMAIHFHCPSCQAKRSASEGLAGRKVRCPDCDTVVEVPKVAAAIEEDAERRTVAIDPDELELGAFEHNNHEKISMTCRRQRYSHHKVLYCMLWNSHKIIQYSTF